MSSFTHTTGTRRRSAGATAGAAPERPPPGLLVLGRYRLERPLGAGGFGTVWIGHDERLERDVAVKILARDRILDGRFEREARVAARLNHPGIVTLYEAAVDDDGAYLVSELIRGSTLGRLLDAGRLSDRDIVQVGVALSEALIHAHAHGVVHRDVKPSNVLVPDQPAASAEVAKLTDFGVARLLGADTLTRTGDVIGTAAYMAPEQADGRQAGAAADLYSLALVLYEALTGINPVAHGAPAQRARRLGAHLPPLRRHRRDLPGDLGQALDLALRPRPRERGTLEELRANLVSSVEQVEDSPGVVAPPWPRRTSAALPMAAVRRLDIGGGPAVEAEVPADEPRRWILRDRAMGGVAAGLTTGLALDLILASPQLAGAVVGVVAGALVTLLPRIGWFIVTLGLGGLLAIRDHAGAAVLVVLAGLLPVIVIPRRATSWFVAVVAVGLGAAGLAGGWPALAGRASRAWSRAGLAVVGWIWLLAAGALAGHGLYTSLPRWAPSDWEASLPSTVTHVIPSVFAPRLLAPGLVWAAGAVVFPWLMLRWLPARVIVVTAWSAGLASATSTTLRLLHSGVVLRPGVVVLGAITAWVLALAPSLVRSGDGANQSTDTAPGLA